jgi:transposase InsO family protein/predicted DNA-binding protein YlxM (UPF0122 family)
MTLTCFHPAIQTSIYHFANPELSLAEIGDKFCITKQATAKRINLGKEFFASYGAEQVFPETSAFEDTKQEIDRLERLVKTLRIQLTIHAPIIFLLTCFKEAVQKFFPRFKLSRLSAFQKKRVIDFWTKYASLGGNIKDFCKATERSPETLRKWLAAYKKYGITGLYDKTTRPHHFSNKIPVWLRDQLVILFKKFPQWSAYQYFKYITGHPAFHFHISIPTIDKLKAVYVEKSTAEKERIKKLWAFVPGTSVWTVDFTCLLKTGRYKLQLLTVSDASSRFLFETALFLDTSTEKVMNHLEDLFIKYGKPYIIKADNGPEFRLDCRLALAEACVYLLNSPPYYGQFNGAHERIHRTLKDYIDDFSLHGNLTRLEQDIRNFRDDYNHLIPLEVLNMKTPAEIFYCQEGFVPKDVEVITPYIKDDELRMKFTNRNGQPARMAMKLIEQSAA